MNKYILYRTKTKRYVSMKKCPCYDKCVGVEANYCGVSKIKCQPDMPEGRALAKLLGYKEDER